MNAAILRLGVYVCDAMNKAGMYNRGVAVCVCEAMNKAGMYGRGVAVCVCDVMNMAGMYGRGVAVCVCDAMNMAGMYGRGVAVCVCDVMNKAGMYGKGVAVCVCDVMNKVGMYGRGIRYVTSVTFFLLFIAEEQTNKDASRSAQIQSKKKKCFCCIHFDKTATRCLQMKIRAPDLLRDVVQVVKHRTGMPLRQVRFLGAARDFSPRVNFQCRLACGVRAAIMCNRMH